ncbi:MAG: alpha/beta hydrolase [Streptosporangiaceae bacterium]
MVLGTLDLYDEVISWYVAQTGVPFLSVGYRRAPDEAAGTTLSEDVFAGPTWLLDHASALGGDPARVAVMGDSGGGAPARRRRDRLCPEPGPRRHRDRTARAPRGPARLGEIRPELPFRQAGDGRSGPRHRITVTAPDAGNPAPGCGRCCAGDPWSFPSASREKPSPAVCIIMHTRAYFCACPR